MTTTKADSMDLLIRATLGDKSAIDELYGTGVHLCTCDGCKVEITEKNATTASDSLCADCADESEAPYCSSCGEPCSIRIYHECDVNAHWIETDCCQAGTVYRNKGLTIEFDDIIEYLEDA